MAFPSGSGDWKIGCASESETVACPKTQCSGTGPADLIGYSRDFARMPLSVHVRKGEGMQLKAIIDDQELTLEVPDAFLRESEPFFAKMDADMDQGWQMSRDWVARPNQIERCQIVGDKLLSALEKENDKLGRLMAGYILSRLPGVESVTLDTHGEIQNTVFSLSATAAATAATRRARTQDPSAGAAAAPLEEEVSFIPGPAPMGLDKFQAMEQAGNDVTQVFKVGKGYRFSVFDHASGQWVDAPLFAREADAERQRQAAFKARFQSLQRQPD